MLRKYTIFIIGLVMSQSVFAASGFQSGFSLRQNNVNTTDYDYSTTAVSGFHYLERIKTNGVPLGEAAYLQRASRITGSLERTTYSSTVNNNRDSDSYSLSYSRASSQSPLTYSLSWANSDTSYTDNAGTEVGDVNYQSYGLTVGYFVARNTHLGVGYSREDYTVTNVIVEYDFSDTYSLSAKHVFLFGGNSALSLSGRYSVTDYSTNDSSDISGAGFDYYIRQNFSIGGDVDVIAGDRKALNGTNVVLRAISFVSRRVSIGIEYIQFTAEDITGKDTEETRILTDIRF